MAITGARAVFLAFAAAITLSFLPVLLAKDTNCVYTVYVRTGSVWRGGTESTITVQFMDSSNTTIVISNLTAWGGSLQGPDHSFFQRGALDVLSGLGDCLDYPICGIYLVSDGKGDGPGWYVNYVEVTFTGAHLACSKHTFEVERWLADDTYPWSLEYLSNECDYGSEPEIEPENHRRMLRRYR